MVFSKKVINSLALISVLACNYNSTKPKSNECSTLFTTIQSKVSGIDFVNHVEQTDDFNCIRYTYALIGAGVATGDINNDGLEDVYLVSNQQSNKLYLNKGDFEFEDITRTSNTQDKSGWSTGVTMVDINNDGWLDIYVCKSASLQNENLRRNKLFVNQKDGTFKEEAKKWGLDHNGFSLQSYFFDYDKDGDLDMFLLNHRHDFENTLRLEPKGTQKYFPETSDHLFRNDGNTFTNVTVASKIINKAWGLSAAIGDFNNDGWPDIHVANDYIAPDFLYINNRDGTFSNQIDARMRHISYNSMGSDYADINNDFLPDLLVLEMSAEDHIRSKENMPTMNTEGFQKIIDAGYHRPYMSNVLQLNNGNGSFKEIAQLAGVAKTDWSWAPLIADFDSDGHKDIFISNGVERNFSNQDYARAVKANLDKGISMTVHEVISMMPSDKLQNYAFKNNKDLTFENTSERWGFSQKTNTNGVAYADFDNDGDLDLVMNNMSDVASIYRNNTTGNYLNITLKGSSSNKDAIGAKIKILTSRGVQYQELQPSRGYLSSVSRVLNFGFDDLEFIERVEVIWPSGNVSILENVPTNQHLVLNSKDAASYVESKNNVVRNLRSVYPQSLGLAFEHQDTPFNDFEKQVLLPQKFSQIGPAIAVTDVNGDGLDDVYLGGGTGQAGVVYLQNTNGIFEITKQKSISTDSDFEDTAAHFFDADNDGDMDLYVASGSYEHAENSGLFIDRLYINDGKGNFSKSRFLPAIPRNTKSIASIDYDDDGDMDIFVGGHVRPGMYPLYEQSYILQNEKGAFIESTELVAPDFQNIGLVNDLLFSDYDGDSDLDLIIAGHWMPITILENSEGTFAKKQLSTLEQTQGWWNALQELDLDQDGDMDYVVGNLGANNKFHPSKDKPLHIYGSHFDENSSYDMILSKEYKGNLVPVRGKECSTQQNQFIKNRMPTFKSFANATLTDIYGSQAIAESYHKEVVQLNSVYLENKGNNTFKIHELPWQAQVGPTLAFEIADVNNDGFLDVLGIGAIHETEVETIPYDANVGYILVSDAQGRLVPYPDINFYNQKNARDIRKIKIQQANYFLIANNNAELTIFKQ